MPRARPIKPFEEARPDVWLVRDAAAKGGLVMVVRLEQWTCSVCGETLCEHVRGPRADVIARLSRRSAATQAVATTGENEPRAGTVNASARASAPVPSAGTKPQSETQSETAEESAALSAPSAASETTEAESEQKYAFETLGIRRKPRPVKVSDRSVQRLGSEAA